MMQPRKRLQYSSCWAKPTNKIVQPLGKLELMAQDHLAKTRWSEIRFHRAGRSKCCQRRGLARDGLPRHFRELFGLDCQGPIGQQTASLLTHSGKADNLIIRYI